VRIRIAVQYTPSIAFPRTMLLIRIQAEIDYVEFDRPRNVRSRHRRRILHAQYSRLYARSIGPCTVRCGQTIHCGVTKVWFWCEKVLGHQRQVASMVGLPGDAS
jgi:hypothetical protein